MKIYCYLRLHLKIICQRFHIIAPFNFWDISTRDIWNVCLQTYRNNRICYKVAYFLRKIQNTRVNNSKILRIKDAKFQVMIFIWTQTYSEIFKSALVYLWQNFFHFFTYLGQTEISKLVCLFDLSNWKNQSTFEVFSLDNVLRNWHCLKNAKDHVQLKLLPVAIQFLHECHL